MTACACMYVECSKAGRCLAYATPAERAMAGVLLEPLPVYWREPPLAAAESATASTEDGSASAAGSGEGVEQQ